MAYVASTTITTFRPSREMIDAVADWQARRAIERVNRPLIPHLRDCFGLDNRQAIAVLDAANRERGQNADPR